MTREIMYRDALREAIDEEMERDRTVFIIGEGIAERGGSYKVTEGLLAKYGPKRVRDTPIAEAGMIGVGVGAAIAGARPIVEILYIDFAMLGMDMLVNQAAKFRLMTGGDGRVPFVMRTQGGTGGGVAAQHSQSLEALFYHIPGLKVVMPSTPADAKGLLKYALRQQDPVMFLEHKHLYMTKGLVPDGEHVIEFGKGDIKRPGKDVTLIAWSNMIPRTLEAAEKLAAQRLEALGMLRRPAAARAARQGHDPRLRRQDQSRGHRAGGCASRRRRLRHSLHHPGGGVLPARCADRDRRRPQHPDPVQPRA
jgi:pyruvate/2-oxoglutarate/acetoin dehydrogenase E1 component